MKSLWYAGFSIWILIFLTSCAVRPEENWESKLQNVVDSVYKENPDAVGIMVHVESPPNGISFSYAKGLASKTDSTLIESDQPILIASCTKSYVSASILKLVEQGKLNLNTPIIDLINVSTKEALISDSYDLNAIKVKHLLSHTSGINDYAQLDYFNYCYENPKHRWSRDEQLNRLVKNQDPIGKPEEKFSYSDANYLLLTEILENIYQSNYNIAISELIGFSELGISNTWFPTIDVQPQNIKPFVHQYYSKYNWDSYSFDVSWDLYGGGGIATTTKELSLFYYKLFNKNIIKDTSVFNQIYTHIQTNDSIQVKYYMGLRENDFSGNKGYGHNGFWGVSAFYFPDSNTSIAVVVLDFDRNDLRYSVIENLIIQLN